MTTKPTLQAEFQEGRGYSREDWDEVCDNPEWAADDFANAKPFRDVFPEMAAAMEKEVARRGRPPLERPKQAVSLRLDQDVIEKFKATGPGWQSRINDVLKAAKVEAA